MRHWEHSGAATPEGPGAFLDEAIRLSSRLSRNTPARAGRDLVAPVEREVLDGEALACPCVPLLVLGRRAARASTLAPASRAWSRDEPYHPGSQQEPRLKEWGAMNSTSPPVARSRAASVPIGAPTSTPPCIPLSDPPQAAVWTPIRPSPTRVEQIGSN